MLLVKGPNMKKAIVLAAVLASAVPAFAFTSGQGARDVSAEVSQRYNSGQSIGTIASAAKAAGVSIDVLAVELRLSTGKSPTDVLAAMMDAGYAAGDVINTLVAAGADRNQLNGVAIAKGADPGTLLASTASGGTGSGSGGGFGGGGGFSGNSFSSSRSGTIGGGGRRSVSSS